MVSQRFATADPVRLEVNVHAGEIEIATTEEGESTVSLSGSQKLLDVTDVELLGDRLVVGQQRKFLAGRFGSLHVVVRVPQGSRVSISTASAESTLVGSFGLLDVKSVSGDLRLTGEISGDARVKTVSGSVSLPRVGGDLDAGTVSGNVDAEAVEGSVTVKSVSGSLRVARLREGTVDFQSVSGDVHLGVAAGTNLDVDAGTASGDLSSEVPLSDVPGEQTGPKLVVRGKTVSGDLRVVRAA
jgi:DUF4097 and DUF4098 domain-containing protein YvlB